MTAKTLLAPKGRARAEEKRVEVGSQKLGIVYIRSAHNGLFYYVSLFPAVWPADCLQGLYPQFGDME